MRFDQVSVPEVYKESEDFRFFLKWFALALERIKFDTENILDLYDPLRCPENLLWMLGDTMGYKYDDRLSEAFNRAVLLYFMSLIRNKGSKDGMVLATELNLKQFDIQTVAETGYTRDGEFIPPKAELWERLEDPSIPVNSVRVTPHVDEGYIDVVYFSSQLPVDACTEYVRPLGMYMFSYPGVRFTGRTKISVDARLTDLSDSSVSLGPTHVGHYRRDDYARLQRIEPADVQGHTINRSPRDRRHPVWYRNSTYEDIANGDGSYGSGVAPEIVVNPGYRALYSLQLCNNEHITQALFRDDEGHPVDVGPLFALGHDPDSIPEINIRKPYNLMYDETAETSLGDEVYTLSKSRPSSGEIPVPAINKPMLSLGDAISLNEMNTSYSVVYAPGTPDEHDRRPEVDDE